LEKNGAIRNIADKLKNLVSEITDPKDLERVLNSFKPRENDPNVDYIDNLISKIFEPAKASTKQNSPATILANHELRAAAINNNETLRALALAENNLITNNTNQSTIQNHFTELLTKQRNLLMQKVMKTKNEFESKGITRTTDDNCSNLRDYVLSCAVLQGAFYFDNGTVESIKASDYAINKLKPSPGFTKYGYYNSLCAPFIGEKSLYKNPESVCGSGKFFSDLVNDPDSNEMTCQKKYAKAQCDLMRPENLDLMLRKAGNGAYNIPNFNPQKPLICELSLNSSKSIEAPKAPLPSIINSARPKGSLPLKKSPIKLRSTK
jgi:hypothetical protein